jgi:hypothetical protein
MSGLLAVQLDLSGRVLTGTVKGTWKDLDIQFGNLAKNLASEIKVKKAAGPFAQPSQGLAVATFRTDRKEDQSMMNWLISGMNEGLRQLVTSSQPQAGRTG